MFILVQYTHAYEPVIYFGPFGSRSEAREYAEKLEGKVAIYQLHKPE